MEYKTVSSGLLSCKLRLYLLAFLKQWNRIVLKINNMDFVSNVSVMLTERSDHIDFSWHSPERSVSLKEADRQKKSAVGDMLVAVWQSSLYVSTDVRAEGRGGEENWQPCMNVVMKQLRLELRSLQLLL